MFVLSANETIWTILIAYWSIYCESVNWKYVQTVCTQGSWRHVDDGVRHKRWHVTCDDASTSSVFVARTHNITVWCPRLAIDDEHWPITIIPISNVTSVAHVSHVAQQQQFKYGRPEPPSTGAQYSHIAAASFAGPRIWPQSGWITAAIAKPNESLDWRSPHHLIGTNTWPYQ